MMYLYIELSPSDRKKFLPNSICGDCDSINPSVSSYYESEGVKIVVDKSQDSTDMQKCLSLIKREQDLASPSMVRLFACYRSRFTLFAWGNILFIAGQPYPSQPSILALPPISYFYLPFCHLPFP